MTGAGQRDENVGSTCGYERLKWYWWRVPLMPFSVFLVALSCAYSGAFWSDTLETPEITDLVWYCVVNALVIWATGRYLVYSVQCYRTVTGLYLTKSEASSRERWE